MNASFCCSWTDCGIWTISLLVFLKSTYCPVQHHLLSCTTPSTVLYKTIYCSVQHHLLSCTTPSTVLYNTFYCPVQHNLLFCTTQSTVLYNTIYCPVQHHLLSCTECAYLLTQISGFPTHMLAKLLKDREIRKKVWREFMRSFLIHTFPEFTLIDLQ